MANPINPLAVRGRIPPNAAALSDFAVNRPDQVEAIWQPFYDYATYPAAGTTSLTFFQLPIGQGGKTLADTNMRLGGQFPNGQRFLCTGLEVRFYPGNAILGGAFPNWQDAFDFYSGGVLRFFIGSKDYMEIAPLDMAPPSSRLAGAMTIGGAEVANETGQYATAAGVPLDITPVLLTSSQNFNVTLQWPTAVPVTAEARVGVVLRGFLYRNSQ